MAISALCLSSSEYRHLSPWQMVNQAWLCELVNRCGKSCYIGGLGPDPPGAALDQGSPASQGAMVEEEDDDDDGSPPADEDDAEWQRGRLEAQVRAERKKERRASPTTEGANSLLGIPEVNRQVLTSSTVDDAKT
jgi:hypothetical protein